VDVTGRRLLRENFFWLEAAHGRDCRKEAIRVYGGGPHFFKVVFDPQAARFVELRINESR
jgi:hypothetical protein